MIVSGGGRVFRDGLANAKAALADPTAGGAGRRVVGRPRWGWFFLLAVLALFVVRAGRLDLPDQAPTLAWTPERWWPLLLTVPIPLRFVASAAQFRLLRHLAVGLLGLLGALAGPLLRLAWRDAFALAAVLGLSLVAVGALALRAFLRTRPRLSGS